jgi:hypothetical protein
VAAPPNSPLLPVYTPGPSASASGSQNMNNSSGITQRATPSGPPTSGQGVFTSHSQQAAISSGVSQGRYLHWCVDANKFETRLFHIPVRSLKDITVISELRSTFQAAKGFRRWFSLTDCHNVKFVIVTAPACPSLQYQANLIFW